MPPLAEVPTDGLPPVLCEEESFQSKGACLALYGAQIDEILLRAMAVERHRITEKHRGDSVGDAQNFCSATFSSENEQSTSDIRETPLSSSRFLPVTTALNLLVAMDNFAVALVLPLLFKYINLAGVVSTGQRELILALFPLSQIVGGIVTGIVMDSQRVRHRTLLFVSFSGSSLSYALLAHGGYSSLVASRILVGSVKQTMNVTKTMMTNFTSEHQRAEHMGRLSASATAAWVLGPSAGALLFKYIHPKAPAVLASLLFLVNLILSTLFLPKDEEKTPNSEAAPLNQQNTTSTKEARRITLAFSDFLGSLRFCCSPDVLGSVIRASLILTWVVRATNCSHLGSFYEQAYGLEPHQQGYIASYQQILGFLIQSLLITPILQLFGGERPATCACAILLSAVLFFQSQYHSSLGFFLAVICPVTAVAYSVMFTALQTLVTTMAPAKSMFSVLSAMDVLQNVAAVTIPFYRTFLIRLMTNSRDNDGPISMDPNPGTWLKCCTLHWLMAAVSMSYFLLYNNRQWRASTEGTFASKCKKMQ